MSYSNFRFVLLFTLWLGLAFAFCNCQPNNQKLTSKEALPNGKASFNDSLLIGPNIELFNDGFSFEFESILSDSVLFKLYYVRNNQVLQQIDVFSDSIGVLDYFNFFIQQGDTLKVVLIDDANFQYQNTLNQFDSLDLVFDNNHEIVFNFNVLDLVYDKFFMFLMADKDYQYKGSKGKLSDMSCELANRYSLDVYYQNLVPDSLLELEVRALFFDLVCLYPHMTALRVKCFKNNNKLPFKVAVFAPFGDWLRSNERTDLFNYKISW